MDREAKLAKLLTTATRSLYELVIRQSNNTASVKAWHDWKAEVSGIYPDGIPMALNQTISTYQTEIDEFIAIHSEREAELRAMRSSGFFNA